MNVLPDDSVAVQKQSGYTQFKKKVYDLLDPRMNTGWGHAMNIFIIAMIVLNTLAVILETVDYFNEHYHTYLRAFDLFSLFVFSTEYVLRLWSCTADEHFRHPVKGRIKYFFTPGALIDLFAILPFYIHQVFGSDLRFIRSLRLMLFFRFLKLGRYLTASRIILTVMQRKKEELTVSLLAFVFMMMLSSCLMYYVEHAAQPEKFVNIPQTMWWSVCTLTTVGYGDVFPITPLGKILTGFIIILGVGLLALPTGIVASGFLDEYQKKKHKSHYCPHCGEKLE
jgi:voltage-gated potassium channel